VPRGGLLGRVVQVDLMKPKLKPPRTKRSKLKCDILLSTSAFKFNLRRYALDLDGPAVAWAGSNIFLYFYFATVHRAPPGRFT